MNTQNNLAVVQRCYELFGKGDIPALLNLLDDNVTWIDPGNVDGLYKGKRQGREEVGKFFKDLNEKLEVTGFDVKTLAPNNNDVIALGSISGASRGSGKPFSTEWAMVWGVKNDRIAFHQLYLDTDNIAKALGK